MGDVLVGARPWELYPELPDAPPESRRDLQIRRRHHDVRYMLFRLRNEAHKRGGTPYAAQIGNLTIPPGFVDHFLSAPINWVQLPDGKIYKIVEGKIRTPLDIGGLGTFASRWDVNSDLVVYSRHQSVWSEWNSVLQARVPIFGGKD